MYLFGGGDGVTARNDLHVLDTESMTWTKIKPQGTALPGGRGYQAGCVFSERFLFISGGSDGKVTSHVTRVSGQCLTPSRSRSATTTRGCLIRKRAPGISCKLRTLDRDLHTP